MEQDIGQWVHKWDQSITPCADVLLLSCSMSHFSFQPVLQDWCNKGRGMCHPVCGMVHIKEPLLLIGKSSYMAAAGFLSRYQNGP